MPWTSIPAKRIQNCDLSIYVMRLQLNLQNLMDTNYSPFKQPFISGIPDPAAAGAKRVTIYTEEKTRAKLKIT